MSHALCTPPGLKARHRSTSTSDLTMTPHAHLQPIHRWKIHILHHLARIVPTSRDRETERQELIFDLYESQRDFVQVFLPLFFAFKTAGRRSLAYPPRLLVCFSGWRISSPSDLFFFRWRQRETLNILSYIESPSRFVYSYRALEGTSRLSSRPRRLQCCLADLGRGERFREVCGNSAGSTGALRNLWRCPLVN